MAGLEFADMKPLTWAQEQRLNWIREMIHVYGYVNREHIMRKFRVSIPQASSDLSLFNRQYPGEIEYSARGKSYVDAGGKPCPPKEGR
jgi:hypothetical protein